MTNKELCFEFEKLRRKGVDIAEKRFDETCCVDDFNVCEDGINYHITGYFIRGSWVLVTWEDLNE